MQKAAYLKILLTRLFHIIISSWSHDVLFESQHNLIQTWKGFRTHFSKIENGCLYSNKLAQTDGCKKVSVAKVVLARNKNIEKESFFAEKAISSNKVDLLGVALEKNINFKSHIENICGTANNKTALFRFRNFRTLEQAKV